MGLYTLNCAVFFPVPVAQDLKVGMLLQNSVCVIGELMKSPFRNLWKTSALGLGNSEF